MQTKQLFIEHLSTSLGWLQICATDNGLTKVVFVEEKSHEEANSHTAEAKKQLAEYFAGKRKVFTLKLAVTGTAFQQQVWQQLTSIPYSQTCCYSDVAGAIGKRKAVRAVGAANGKNPISIIVPCHRVIGANGTLTGYAGGLSRKKWLLDWEQQHQ